MDWSDHHPFLAEFTLDGGDLGWFAGLRLLILRQMDHMNPGDLLEVSSADSQTDHHLSAWCGHGGMSLISKTRTGATGCFLLCNGQMEARSRPPISVSPEPSRLVVRRLPSLALLSFVQSHPGADVIPHGPAGDSRQLTTTTLSLTETLRTDIERLLNDGVQLVRVVLPGCFDDPLNLAQTAELLNLALERLPPERLALELSQPADALMVAFLCAMPVGTVIVPCHGSLAAELQPLRNLPVEKHLAVGVEARAFLDDDLSRAVELFGIDRLAVWTASVVAAEIDLIVAAVRRLRERYGVSGQSVESVY